MKIAVAAVLVVALFGLVAAQAPVNPGFPTPLAAVKSAVATNATNKAPALSTFASLVEKAKLGSLLTDYRTKQTIFAPSNDAFAALNLTMDQIDAMATSGLLKDLLSYHVVPNAGMSAARLATLAGATGKDFATALLKESLNVKAVAASATARKHLLRKLLQTDNTTMPADNTTMPADNTTMPAADNTTMPTADNTTMPTADNTTMPAATEPAAADNTTMPAEPAAADNTTMPAEPAAADTTTMPAEPAAADNATMPAEPAAADNMTMPAEPTATDNTTMPVEEAAANAAAPGPLAAVAGAATAAGVTLPAAKAAAAVVAGKSLTVTDSSDGTASVVYPDLYSGETFIQVVDAVLIPESLKAKIAEATAPAPNTTTTTTAADAAPAPAARSSATGVAVSALAALVPAALIAML